MSTPQKAILIDIIHPRMNAEQSLDRMEELESLVTTYGGIVIVKRHQRRFAPHPRTFIGPGKIEMLAEEGKEIGAKLLIINNILKPRQTYLISEKLRPYGIEVWDRVDLILKIFAKHASTTEARLEIELASIRHMGPRIFGMGMELSRQGGGVGTRGIGETNTERMKRHLDEKERVVKKKLEKYKKVREGHRKNRRAKDLKTVALVGYTNAGKTTLLNALTKRKELAEDKLFATLDTRIGELYLPETHSTVLLSDTIGFIKNLPPELIDAFESTLSQSVHADLLLHTVDAADEKVEEHIQVVDEILERLGAIGIPRLIVFNKSESITAAAKKKLVKLITNEDGEVREHLFVSAIEKQGFDELKELVANKVVTKNRA